MKLHQCPEVSVVQEVMIIELPALFDLCLSREFTSKLGGYLSMNYNHYIIPCKGRRVKIKREDAYPYHVERIEEENVNFGQMEDIDLLTEELNTLGVEAFESLNIMISDGHGNYCIPEPDARIPTLIKIEHGSNNIWKMFFNGARSKARVGANVVFISPLGKRFKFSFKLT